MSDWAPVWCLSETLDWGEDSVPLSGPAKLSPKNTGPSYDIKTQEPVLLLFEFVWVVLAAGAHC